MAGAGAEPLELTGEEVERLRAAFRDERFRALLAEYAAELSDPAARQRYEEEVTALERERGVDVRFVHPEPGYVLRTSQEGAGRCYLNVCGSPLLGRPAYRLRLRLPYAVDQARGCATFDTAARRLLVTLPVLRRPGHSTAAATCDSSAPEQAESSEASAGDPGDSTLVSPGAPGPAKTCEGPAGDPGDSTVATASVSSALEPGKSSEGPAGDSSDITAISTCATSTPEPAESREGPARAPSSSTGTATCPHSSTEHHSGGPAPARAPSNTTATTTCASSAPEPAESRKGLARDPSSSKATTASASSAMEPDKSSEGPAADPSDSTAISTCDSSALEPAESCEGPAADPSDSTGATVSPRSNAKHHSSGPAPARAPSNTTATTTCASSAQPAVPTKCPFSSLVFAGAPSDSSDISTCASSGLGLAGPAVHTCSSSKGPPGSPSSTDCLACPSAVPIQCPCSGPVPAASSSNPSTSLDPAVPAKCPKTSMDLPLCPSSDLDPAVPAEHPCSSPASLSSSDGAALTSCSSTDLLCPSSSRPAVISSDSLGLPACPSSNTERAVPAKHHSSMDHPLCLSSTQAAAASSNNSSDLPACPGSNLDSATPSEWCCSHVDLPVNSSSCPSSPMATSSMTPPVCPPFQCTQDEESLTLLVQVPGIQPQSLKGEVGTNHYGLSFSSKDAASYSFFLQFPFENKLTAPETGVNVSPSNAVIGLAKSPESTGLWKKLSFGLNSHALQERLFVSEENIDEFLGSILSSSFSKQSALESQPLIEILNVTEDNSQIRLKPQAVDHSEFGGKEQTVNNTGEEPVERGNGNCLQTKTETNQAAADAVTKGHATETDAASGPLRAAAETMAKAGCSSSHYLQQDPAETSVAIPVKAQRHKPELALTLSTEQSTASLDHAKQESLPLEKETNIREREVVTGSEPGAESQHNPNHRPASPVIKEINTQDGSMQIIRDHTTRCAVVFQNSVLYELD
ncbi:PREDICTED: protein kintoun [Gavialis gangeticus]|uniref:protein kintoun n=1 Tax=Gavialis gangeticus TaxID=94835 RepID=UPI00092E7BBB|nr:PREDICTED: protein kintoun [Gavialis gangeticus]